MHSFLIQSCFFFIVPTTFLHFFLTTKSRAAASHDWNCPTISLSFMLHLVDNHTSGRREKRDLKVELPESQVVVSFRWLRKERERLQLTSIVSVLGRHKQYPPPTPPFFYRVHVETSSTYSLLCQYIHASTTTCACVISPNAFFHTRPFSFHASSLTGWRRVIFGKHW